MVRTKNVNVGRGELTLSQRYECPFELQSELEGEIFKKFNENYITPPHYFDWELITDLNLEEQVELYLQNLGMKEYAKNIDFSGYDPLCYEFMTTVEMAGDMKWIKARMYEREYHISLARMKAVFGFSIGGLSDKTRGWNVNQAWNRLTDCDNWDSSGMPSGYIKDPALAIVHKFLAYNVSGKEQANKVNAVEVFLLECALDGTKVCISKFIWAAMIRAKKRPTAHASFAAIITGLAHKNGVLAATEGPIHGQDELDAEYIDYNELRVAQLISDQYTLVPHAKRTCVVNYIHSEIAAGRRPRIDPGVGPSGTAGDDEEEENEEKAEEEAEEAEDEDEGNGERAAGGSMSRDYHQQVQNDLTSFRAHFDSSMGAFRAHFDSSMTSMRNDMNACFDAQDQQIAELQRQWDSWRPRF